MELRVRAHVRPPLGRSRALCPNPKPQTRLVLPPVWQRPLEMREAREHGPCSLRELRENFARARPGLGLSRAKGRELGQHWPRRGRNPGSRGGARGRGMS